MKRGKEEQGMDGRSNQLSEGETEEKGRRDQIGLLERRSEDSEIRRTVENGRSLRGGRRGRKGKVSFELGRARERCNFEGRLTISS